MTDVLGGILQFLCKTHGCIIEAQAVCTPIIHVLVALALGFSDVLNTEWIVNHPHMLILHPLAKKASQDTWCRIPHQRPSRKCVHLGRIDAASTLGLVYTGLLSCLSIFFLTQPHTVFMMINGVIATHFTFHLSIGVHVLNNKFSRIVVQCRLPPRLWHGRLGREPITNIKKRLS